MRLSSLCVLFLAAVTGLRAQEEGAAEKEWPECDSAAADKTAINPLCDPCSPKVYVEYANPLNTEVYQKATGPLLRNYNLKGWTRFMSGTGKLLTTCPLRYSCGGIYPIWLNSEHPEEDAGITDGEVCAHFTSGNCCTWKRAIRIKNCGSYMVYLLTYNSPVSSSYNGAYCVAPTEQPDVCNDSTFTLKEDTMARGELQTATSNLHEPIVTDNTDNWFSFTAGKGTIKKSCPGLHHCGFRYPMWLGGEYPTEEGKITMSMGHVAATAANICAITQSAPVYIVKCGLKYYHKFQKSTNYAGYCIEEDFSDVCENAVDLAEEWRGTTIEKTRDHCDTLGLNDYESWYRMKVYEKKMPDHCVAPNKCGGDTGYYVGDLGHPVPGEGIVGRTFHYASATNCKANSLTGHILNCGNKDDGDDYVYKWTKPSGCDRVFCAEQDPCSSTVYKKLEEDFRAARGPSTDRISDNTLEHGWYRFPRDEGIMARSPVLPGHSGITYPGWYDGEYPLEEDEEKTGRACFTVNGNHCYPHHIRPVTVRNCKNFYVYHLQQTAANYGYTFEQDVCKKDTVKLDQEWRLQYNLDAIAMTDSTLTAGWYEVTIGQKQLATEKTLYKHGGTGKHPGWIEGEHPSEAEGIVERTVWFTTTDANTKGASTKVYIRNCGSKYIYYLRPYSNNYFYAIADNVCQQGSYQEVDQANRLYSNPSELNLPANSDRNFFKTYTAWYRFMNGNGRLAEYPKIKGNWWGGFQYPYQFEEGSHASVPNPGDISEELIMEHYRSPGTGIRGGVDRYIAWTWKLTIKNCGGYYIYKIPPTGYSRTGLVVDDNEESVCEAGRYTESDDEKRLVSSTDTTTGTSDYTLAEGWYRLTAGLGYMPTSTFVGTQCSTTYHGHLQFPHPTKEEGIVQNNVKFMSTHAGVTYNVKNWVKACDGFYLYRLKNTPTAATRYCEATPGCKNAREINDDWRVNSRKMLTGRYESRYFGNDGWVYFTQGLKRIPESPPPKAVGGCNYNGYIDSHPNEGEGAVTRVMRFPGVDKTQNIEVENCGDKYVYFLTRTIQNDYCYVADTDVCSDNVYKEVDDVRRLKYSHKYGTGFTRFNLDNLFNGWIRYTIGTGRMMEEPPAVTNMCTTEYQGWIDGEHPRDNEGVVQRKVCWKYNGNDCHSSNEISVKNCGKYYVYGIVKPPPNNQYGHCVEQDKTEVCEAATKLNNPKRGMLTPTTSYVNDQLTVVEDGYYRFMSGLGRLTAFQVKDNNCGGTYKVLISDVLEKDEESGDALFALRMHTTGFTGTTYRNLALKCDGYWVYRLFKINYNQLAYCVEEDVCTSSEIKNIYSTNALQWAGERTGNEWQSLTSGWYEVKVGNKRLAYSPSDLYDCGATYPGYINSVEPKEEDGIVPGKVCYRTSATADQSSCQVISMKKCANKEIYYLNRSPNLHYAMCVETDVCASVEGTPLDDTWRLAGAPVTSGGTDNQAIGWYKVTIGNERLAHTREEATCGAKYQGWMTLGRHPAASEGTVNTKICYDTGNGAESNCKKAQVVNCGGHYLYHLEPATTYYGACVVSGANAMCEDYEELGEEWRSTDYSATHTNTDTSILPGWYRFTTGRGRMASHCPDYLHGGGYYPSYALDLVEPTPDEGPKEFTIMWRYTGNNCAWINQKGQVKNCGDYLVYWLPYQGAGRTTYNVETEVCDSSSYEVIEDDNRLAWKATTDSQSDSSLAIGWYRFNNGLKKINEECTPQKYGGTEYPGWMEGGHPDVGETATRNVYFRAGANCKQTSKSIKVKNCGAYYIYKLVPTLASRAYTVASDPCGSDPREFDQDDRSVYTRSVSMINDNGLTEGWYQFTVGNGVMPKTAPMPKSCRTTYPTWLNGADPSPGEGVVQRTLCVVNGVNTCQWQKEINVRNCGNNKMLYYLTTSPPYVYARYCVEDSMDNVCKSAKPLDDEWRGERQAGTGKADRNLPEGWYKFTAHAKRMANHPVKKNVCGADYPIYMVGEHVEKGTCSQQGLEQVHSDITYRWNGRSGTIMECHCMNDDYIYYHVPNVVPLTSYNGVYCVEEDPCNNHDRMTGDTRSPWYTTIINNNDHTGGPRWVRIESGLGVMPRFAPDATSCGNRNSGWYNGEMPAEAGDIVNGKYCFVHSEASTCNYEKPAKVKKCPGGFYVYHLLPTPNYHYGYCADADVCDIAAEEWGREENHRLQHTSTTGYYSTTQKTDNTLGSKWVKITTGLGRLPTECPGYMSCGTRNPGWMEGEHPVPADRVVDRKVCFLTSTKGNCCAASKNIKVVSCERNNKQFYLYRLVTTTHLYGYCIDESPDDVCNIPDSSIKHFTDQRHGTGHYNDASFLADYRVYTIPSWMEVNIHKNILVHQPPVQYFCGAIYAGWVEDPAPGPNEGVIDSRACYRDSMANEQCYQPMPLKMKNCNGKMRYLYAPVRHDNRKMCVEEDVCDANSHEVFDGETWRLAYTKTEGTDYKKDYRKMEISPYRGWFRFTGVGDNKITEIQQEYQSCGTQYPGWMLTAHPSAEDGVVKRTIAFTTTATNYNGQRADIYVKNCGSYMVYNMNFNWWNNWGLCIDTDVCKADVAELDEGHRLVNAWGKIAQTDDRSLPRGWYRFTNGFEKMPEKCPIAESCGSLKPGYLSQPHPDVGEGIVERKVCFGDADQCCSTSRDVLVKNCGAHFVYRLYPTTTYEKYCVQEGVTSMCNADLYTELDEEWRGETNVYDATARHDDTQLTPGNWYRFTAFLGKMPEYSMSINSCGFVYPGYLQGTHPTRQEGIKNYNICFSTSMTNEGQACKFARVRNCGSYYVYQMQKPANYNYGFCVAQDQCKDARELDDRWRLIINPTIRSQSNSNDNTVKKGWYRLTVGHGTMPTYQPDNNYGGGAYPSWMEGDLPAPEDGEVERTAKFGSTTHVIKIRVKDCGDTTYTGSSLLLTTTTCGVLILMCACTLTHYQRSGGTSFTCPSHKTTYTPTTTRVRIGTDSLLDSR
ncbi:uncharacterized protein LOC134823987 [Bolinopsis microptera]|uniref:uncharacterized protein LOC134823987 n=1 Tax=Bolinopsis microptera TaxID=2820187 RepID=UPI0030794A7C